MQALFNLINYEIPERGSYLRIIDCRRISRIFQHHGLNADLLGLTFPRFSGHEEIGILEYIKGGKDYGKIKKA